MNPAMASYAPNRNHVAVTQPPRELTRFSRTPVCSLLLKCVPHGLETRGVGPQPMAKPRNIAFRAGHDREHACPLECGTNALVPRSTAERRRLSELHAPWGRVKKESNVESRGAYISVVGTAAVVGRGAAK